MNALAMIVDCHRQLLLGGLLPNHVLIEVFLDFQRFGKLMRTRGRLIGAVVFQDRVADSDAFVANVGSRVIAGGRDELANYVLTLMTKGTTQGIIGSGTFHAVFSSAALSGQMGECIT